MNPIFLRYEGLAVRYSHLIFLAAFLICYFLFIKVNTQPSEQENLEKSLFLFIFGGLLGGRLSYILINWSLFNTQWLDVFTPWHGAFTLWGGILGIIVFAGMIDFLPKSHFRERKNSLARLAYTFPLFLSLSQWGLWFEGEGWGRQAEGLGTMVQGGISRYPIWLYLFGGYLILSILLFVYRKKSAIFLGMLIGIGFLNIILTPFILFIKTSEFVVHLFWSAILILGGIYRLLNLKKFRTV